MKRVLLIALVAFLFSLTPVLATTFDADLIDATINSNSNNVLVNFTIENTGVVGIVQINVTLPPGFSYDGSQGTTVSSGILFSPSGPRWYNSTILSILDAGDTEHFWFRVTTPSAGSYAFNITTSDTSNGFSSENVSVTTADLTAPMWSANSTTPSSPTAYALDRNYTFNVTWTENTALENVRFEWDQSTNYTNTTTPAIQSLGSGKYSITLSDLTTGNYTYKWYAEDNSSQENATDLLAYNITVADNPINLYLNGNMNQNLVINHGEEINVTATGGGLVLYKNNTIVSNPYIDSLPIGVYQFKANSSGNANYTSNATGVSKTLSVVHPAPRYSISTSIPTTWSLNAFALFNITWSDENDADAFDTVFIQLNHSGSPKNYTMTRRTGTNVSTYQLNISVPMSLTWKVYANNSYNTWNSTPLYNVTIGKIAPTLSLTASPAWTVAKGTWTSVHCTSDQVSVILYREGTQVSNPDIQTLGTGDYFYWCNSSATANYSAASKSSILYVLRYVGGISFSSAESLISIKQGSSRNTTVILENTGNASQTINFKIENITSSWYTINATQATTAVGENAAFLINFTISESAEIADYKGNYSAWDNTNNVTSSFVLRVLPKEGDESNITDELALYRVNMTKVWTKINNSKNIANVTAAEAKILDAKEKIELAEDYIANGDYFSAYQLFSDISSLINSAQTELDAALTASRVGILGRWPNWMTWAVVAIVICVIGFLLYLLWPQPGYSAKTGRYTYKPKKKINPLSKFKKKLKTRQGLKSEVDLSEIKIEEPIEKRGRYTIEKSKKKGAGINIYKVISKIKDIFKRK
jgi:hypothetical protein